MNKVQTWTIIVMALVIVYLATCNRPKPCPPSNVVTKVIHDTLWADKKDSSDEIHPTPVSEDLQPDNTMHWGVRPNGDIYPISNDTPKPKKRSIWKRFKPLPSTNVAKENFTPIGSGKTVTPEQNIVADYSTIRTYFDSVYIDPKHKEYGKVYRKEKVQYNKIESLKWYMDLHFPTIRESTNTTTQVEKQHFQLYIGGTLQGTTGSILNASGPTIGFKTKGDKFYQGSVLFTTGHPIYQVTGLFKVF